MYGNRLFYLLSLLVLTIVSCNSSKTKTKSIVFVGDLLLDRGVRDRIEHLGIDHLFHTTIDSVFERNDIVIANLECPATTIKEPIHKKYIFRAEPKWLKALKEHHITHLTMANNHSMDQGRNGLIDTEKNIKENGLVPLGYGKNLEAACTPQLIATSPRKVYVLSSLQVPSENWPFLENKPCVCEESFDAIGKRVQKLKKDDPNAIIIVQLHWGAEHTVIPLVSQKQQGYTLIDAGVDVIIGHHTHTIQPVEAYKDGYICYSLGNFIFDQSNPINSKGLMIQLEITKTGFSVEKTEFNIEKYIPRL